MEKIFSGSLMECFLMGCCSLYQETNDINLKRLIASKFKKNISLYEISEITNIGIYIDNEFINSYFSKFIILSKNNNLFSLCSKLVGDKYQTIFSYNEISKNLMNLPDEMLSLIANYSNKDIKLVNKKLFEISDEVFPSKIYTIFDKIKNNKNVRRFKFDEKDGIFPYQYDNIEELYIHINPNFNFQISKDLDKVEKLFILLYPFKVGFGLYSNANNNFRNLISKFKNLNTLYLFQQEGQIFYNTFTDNDDFPILNVFRTNLLPLLTNKHFKIFQCSYAGTYYTCTYDHIIIDCISGVDRGIFDRKFIKTVEMYNLEEDSLNDLCFIDRNSTDEELAKGKRFQKNNLNIIIHYTFNYKFNKYTDRIKANNGIFYCDKKYQNEIRKNLNCLSYTFFPSEEYKNPLYVLEDLFLK